VITLQALQTQDPFDLILYILNDLRHIVEASVEEQRLIDEIKEMLDDRTLRLGTHSNDIYRQSRLKLLKEKYSAVLGQITSVIGKATEDYQLIIVLEDFELLAGDRQTFLYNLMDIISHGYVRKSQLTEGNRDQLPESRTTVTPITAIMVTSRLDSFSMLEKRVASRFPQRQIIVNGPTCLRDLLFILYKHLIISNVPLLPEHEFVVRRRKAFRERFIESVAHGITCSSQMVADVPEEELLDYDLFDEQDDPSRDLQLVSESSDIAELNDPNSQRCRIIHHRRRVIFEWNRSVMAFFSNMPVTVMRQLQTMSEITLNIPDYYQVILSALRHSTFPRTARLPLQELRHSILDFITHLSGRVQVGLSCSVLQIILLVEMDRLEQQLTAGWEKSGNLFHDFALPSQAMAIDLGTNARKGKRKSDGTQLFGDGELTTVGARQDSLRLQFYHFDRVYHEYSRWITSDSALSAFKFPKHVIYKAFEGLLRINFVSYCSQDRYHQPSSTIRVSSINSSQQFLKLLLSTEEIETILDQYPEPLPQGLKERSRI